VERRENTDRADDPRDDERTKARAQKPEETARKYGVTGPNQYVTSR